MIVKIIQSEYIITIFIISLLFFALSVFLIVAFWPNTFIYIPISIVEAIIFVLLLVWITSDNWIKIKHPNIGNVYWQGRFKGAVKSGMYPKLSNIIEIEPESTKPISILIPKTTLYNHDQKTIEVIGNTYIQLSDPLLSKNTNLDTAITEIRDTVIGHLRHYAKQKDLKDFYPYSDDEKKMRTKVNETIQKNELGYKILLIAIFDIQDFDAQIKTIVGAEAEILSQNINDYPASLALFASQGKNPGNIARIFSTAMRNKRTMKIE